MLTDAVQCTIERRLLVNFRIAPEVLARQLPHPLRPLDVNGWAVGGVCFLRLGRLRPERAPRWVGLTTENVAHRYAVEWDVDGGVRSGVYVPRRDTDSRLVSWSGGRVFSGRYDLAAFQVVEHGSRTQIEIHSRDGAVDLSVDAAESDNLESVLFSSVEDAMAFFKRGSLSYSPGEDCFDGVELDV